jgi:hypothetical protein
VQKTVVQQHNAVGRLVILPVMSDDRNNAVTKEL